MNLDSRSPESTLADRAAGGDAEAQFSHGLALLDGGNAIAEGPRALELIEAASRQDHPSAVEFCALLEATGSGRPQSWERAIVALERAARLGSGSAAGQLTALNERRNSSGGLFQAPDRRKLWDSPRILAFPGFATRAECDWVIKRAATRLARATVFDPDRGGQTHDSARDNSAIEFQLPQMDLVLEVLRTRISAVTRLPVPIFEPIQVLRYGVGEQFRPHHDFLDPNIPEFAENLRLYGQRIATVLVYLNDKYSGGETVFEKLGISFRGSRGDALFFTNVDRAGLPDPLTTHAGRPPTAGEKWVISQWIRDRAPASPLAVGASAE
jgi:hypothetical protein